jgi:hypothetical protein
MRKVKIFSLAVLMALALCPGVRADTIWSDGFESGNFSGQTSVSSTLAWQAMSSVTYAHSGSYRASVKGPNAFDGDVLLFEASFVGYKDISFEYWYRFPSYTLATNDHVRTQYSLDAGASWHALADYTKTAMGEWTQASFSLPAYADNNSQLEFRVLAQLSGDGNRMWFDDFVLSGEPIPEPASISIFTSFLFFLSVRKFRKKS